MLHVLEKKMRRDVPPQKISKLRLFPSQSVPLLSSTRDIFKISKDAEYIWIARGCSLEIFSCPQLQCINYWGFPSLAKNPDVYISDVEELPSGAVSSGYKFNRAPYLLVSLAGVNYLCLFDICNATVLKCIHMPLPITSLEVISHQGGACLQTRPLAPNLRLCFGMVAVGTEGGRLLLTDLCLDEKHRSDELQPAEVHGVSCHAVDVPQMREQALEYNEHLCFDLSEGCVVHSDFYYKGSHNKTLGIINAGECSITSLLYVPHATLLIVGFNFGCFQLWNLQDMTIIYASSLPQNPSPVVNFAFQEPENDPRNYCYLWVVYGQSLKVYGSESCVTTATLYSLNYDRKDWLEGFGFLYQKLNHCFLRFEHPLTQDPFNSAVEPDVGGSRLISFGMIQDNHLTTNSQQDIEEPQADEWSNQDLSLCLMVWEAWEPQEPSGYFMLLFDINQWYHAQMPSTVRRPDVCSFLGVFSLAEVMDIRNSTCDFGLKSVHVPVYSLHKFKTLLPADEIYYPSSIAFGATCLTDCGVLEVKYLGTQRQLLWELKNLGPTYLKEPTEMFLHCCCAGLLSHSDSISLNQKREALLSLALEYDLLPYLKECVLHSPTVDHNAGGFTLRFITEWAWKKTSQIKTALDRLCLPLFNCSGQELDQSSLALLYSYSSQLRVLACLYRIMQLQATQAITQAGFEEISLQGEVAQLLSIYLQVILWLHQYCCLLPEHAEGEAYGENEVAYPATLLAEAYDQRRRCLHKLHSSVSPTDLLLIDGLMSKLNDNVPMHWERPVNSDANGGIQRLYPPPSLYAFLNIYLVNGVDIMDKHCLTLYLLLDMADFLSDKQSHLGERLRQFPAAFFMPPSKVKIVQGFWMLDRKDFAQATSFLTDPVVQPWDLTPMLHSRVLKSFLYQGQEKHALRYVHVRQPPLDTPEDIKLHLSLLLANRLIIEAYKFQQQRHDEDLLNHFFLGCQQTGNMRALLELPLGRNEEQALIKFLSDSSQPTAKEMLILYLLQRNRPLEALEFTDKLKRKDDPMNICNSLVDQFIKILPSAQVHLAKELSKPFTRTNQSKVSIPLSALSVRKEQLPAPVSKSTQLLAVKEALYNTWNKHASDVHSPLRTKSHGWALNSMPFVGSPAITEHPKNDTELVYATPVGKRPGSGVRDNVESSRFPYKKYRGMDIISPMKKVSSERRKSRSLNSDALLLLQTPPIKRQVPDLRVCTPSSGRKQVIPALPSILKASQRLVPTPTQLPIPLLEEPQLGNTFSDLQPGDLSETDMELQDCASTSTSEEYEEPVQEMEHSSFLSVDHRGKNSEMDTLQKSTELSISDPASFSSPSFHKSDELVLEDDDVTLNFSMQKRREDTVNLGRTRLRAPGQNIESFYKSLTEEMHLKNLETTRTDTSSHIPVTDMDSSECVTRSHGVQNETTSKPVRRRNFDTFFKSFTEQMKTCSSDSQRVSGIASLPSTSENFSVASVEIKECFKEPQETPVAEESSLQATSGKIKKCIEEPQEIPVAKETSLQATSAETNSAAPGNTFTEDEKLKEDLCEPFAMSVGEEYLQTSHSPDLAKDSKFIVPNEKLDSIPQEMLHSSPTLKQDVYEDVEEMPCEILPSVTDFPNQAMQYELEHNYQKTDDEAHTYKLGSLDAVDESVNNDDKVVYEKSLPSVDVEPVPCLSSIQESPVKSELCLELISDEEPEVGDDNISVAVSSNLVLETAAVTVKSEVLTAEEEMDVEGSVFDHRTLPNDDGEKELATPEQQSVHELEETQRFDVIASLRNTSVQTSFNVTLRQDRVPEVHDTLDVNANETGPFEVNSVSERTSAVECLQNLPEDPSDSVFYSTTAEEKRSTTVVPSSKKPGRPTRMTRSRYRDSIEQSTPVSRLLEAQPVSSSELSPSSSVFTTPEKTSPMSTWNTRLRPRSESRTSSDSSPQTVRETDRRRARTRQISSTPSPSPQLIATPAEGASHRKGTRSSRKGTRQRIKPLEGTKQSSSSIPEEPEETQPEELTPKPALPFVFSPPATRSWTRRKKSDTPDRNPPEKKGIGLLSPEVTSGRREKRDSTQGASSSNWEDYVNLISPFTGKETKPRRSTVSSRSSTTSRHSMTLRTGVLKTRKVVKLK